ncbi:MAG: WD40 repeat domain-containing protein [Rhodospirillales bacterium]|nr:WD40 repeat domain-containing protein [Rhodospirillales bacterium]
MPGDLVSETAARFAVETRGSSRALGSYVTAACFDRSGQDVAFAAGDGNLHRTRPTAPAEWTGVAVHDGAALCLAAHPVAGFVSGGDDGALHHLAADGTVHDLAAFGMKWVEHVATVPGENGVIAAAVGRIVHLFDARGRKLRELAHPSTVTGLAFDPKGKRIATSHYNGASLWFVGAKAETPRILEWKGSHIGVALHPGMEAVVTAMQENALHGWSLPEAKHMRMSGYPGKTRAMSFSRGGKWLATSGSDAMVLWPFFGGGPMGKAPMELAGGDGVVCTSVAFHPREDVVAGGFADGLVVLADVNSSRILPVVPPGNEQVSALAWSPAGTHLAIGTAGGFAAIVDLSKR